MDDKLWDDITLEAFEILMSCITKGCREFYPLIFLEQSLLVA